MQLTEKEKRHQIRTNEIKDIFAKLKKSDDKYSLRKLAKAVKVDASTLSQYFRGKRHLTGYCHNLIMINLMGSSDLKEIEGIQGQFGPPENKNLKLISSINKKIDKLQQEIILLKTNNAEDDIKKGA